MHCQQVAGRIKQSDIRLSFYPSTLSRASNSRHAFLISDCKCNKNKRGSRPCDWGEDTAHLNPNFNRREEEEKEGHQIKIKIKKGKMTTSTCVYLQK